MIAGYLLAGIPVRMSVGSAPWTELLVNFLKPPFVSVEGLILKWERGTL